MTGPSKPVPAGAEQIQSFQFFRDTVQSELDKAAKQAGKPAVKFDVSKAEIHNRINGDGSFSIIYKDTALDFSCTALLNWKSQELLIRKGSASKPGVGTPVAGKRIDDACSATEKLAGKEELSTPDGKGKDIPLTCQDGVSDPRLVGADKYTSIQEFEKQCKSLFDDYGRQKFGRKMGDRFDLNRTRIYNATPGDGNYSLLFEDRIDDFFCQGDVEPSLHGMAVRSGSIFKIVKDNQKDGLRLDDDLETILSKYDGQGTVLPMNDACSMTTGLLGKDELLDPTTCKDATAGERQQQNWLSLGFHGVMTGLMVWQGFKLYRKLSAMPRMQALFRLPIIRNLGWGALTYLGYDTIASNFVKEDHWARKYGSPIAGGAGLVAPEVIRATGLASRLSTIPLASRVAPIASRATIGLAAVWVMNKGFQWGVGSDYEASVNRRVTDQIYDKHVYELDGWDFFVLPLAVKGLRAGSRFLAPDAIEWAVMKDNADLKEMVYTEDKDNSEKGEAYMREVLPLFLHAENAVDRDAFVALLRKAPELSFADVTKASVFFTQGAEGLKKVYPEMNEEEIELFARKALAYQVQETAKFLVFVEQGVNDWAREVFNADGTLKEGEDAVKKLKERWPAPALPKKASLDSHDIELSQTLSKYG